MKRKLLKLLILSIIGSIFVYMIYSLEHKDKINYVVLGDYIGVYDDTNNGYANYIKKYLQDNKKLKNYNNYSSKEETVNSLNRKIETTADIKMNLREANLVTISIGLADFYNNLTISVDSKHLLELKDEIEKMLPKLEKVLNTVRKYAKYDVILVGYYNPVPFLFNTNESQLDILFLYVDGMVKDIVKKYDIKYISLYDLFKNNNYISKTIYPNQKGYKEISNQIMMTIDKSK